MGSGLASRMLKKGNEKGVTIYTELHYYLSSRFTSDLCKSRLDGLYLFDQNTNSLHKQILWRDGTGRLDVDYDVTRLVPVLIEFDNSNTSRLTYEMISDTHQAHFVLEFLVAQNFTRDSVLARIHNL